MHVPVFVKLVGRHLLFCHVLCMGFTQTLVLEISGDYTLLLGPAELLHLW